MKSYGISIPFHYYWNRILPPINLFEKRTDLTPPQRVIMTPSCGTASLTIPLSEKVCELTAEVAKRWGERSMSIASVRPGQ